MQSIYSYAKINLFLDILNKQNSGLHRIRSIFAQISFADVIKYKQNALNTLRFFDEDNNKLSSDNLIVKAAAVLLIERQSKKDGYDFYLKKNLPIGGGLGGGSSNAATMLILLNKLLRLNYGNSRLKTLASHIGSDVPFFIDGRVQKVFGTGNLCVPILTNSLPLYCLLVIPTVKVSTAQAYGILDKLNLCKDSYENKKRFKGLTKAIKKGDYDNIIKNIYNKFQTPIVSEHKELQDIFETIEKSGADKVFMSGSGSTMVGIYNTKRKRDKGLSFLLKEGYNAKDFHIIP